MFAVPYQSIPTFQLFKSVSIHNQYFKIYPGCIAFQKGGIHNNQHTKILTISHRQVHHANDIDNEKKNNPLDQHSCLLKSRWYPNVMSYLLGELRSLEFSTMQWIRGTRKLSDKILSPYPLMLDAKLVINTE